MSRTVITVTGLVLITSTLLVSASDNPFARWEQVRTETENSLEESKQAAKATTAAPAFFSGRQQPVVKTPDIKKERMQTAHSSGQPTVTHATATHASGAVELGSGGQKIQQVGAEFFELFDEPSVGMTTSDTQAEVIPADDKNPFAEFLAFEQGATNKTAIVTSGTADLTAKANQLVMKTPDSSIFEADNFGIAPPSTNVVSADDFDLNDFGGMPSAMTAGMSDEITSGMAAKTSGANPFRAASATSDTSALTNNTPAYRPEPSTGAQQSRVTIEWVSREDFNVGQTSRCELIVRNDGIQAVRSVEVEIALPEGLQVTQATPAPAKTSATATWTFPEMAAGEEKTIELTVIPQQPGDVRMDAFVRTTAATASLVSVKQPKLAITVNGPNIVELGQQIHYTVTVKNPGSGRVNNVLIQAAIPEGLQHRQGGLLNIDVGTLNPGEQRQARLSLTGIAGGSRELSVRALGDSGLQETANATILVAEPKLRIGVRGPISQMAGTSGNYELVVVNEGQAESNNVRARYQLPEGYEFISASAGGHFDSKESTIEWFLGTLSPKDAKRFQVELKATTTGSVAHQVGVISEQGKVSTASHQTTVKGNAKLQLKFVSSKPTSSVGEELVYKLQIENVGQATAANVGLSFEVPPGIDLVEVTGPSEYIADNGVVIFRSLPEMPVGKSATFTIRARCTRSGEHKVRARVASQSIKKAIIAESTTAAR